MSKKQQDNKNKEDLAEFNCKAIYKRFRYVWDKYSIGEKRLNEILQMNGYDAALQKFVDCITANAQLTGIAQQMLQYCGSMIINDIFDVMYFYRRNLHLAVNGVPKIENVTDLTPLMNLDKDVCLDIYKDGASHAIFISRRLFPIQTRKENLEFTFQVFSKTPKHSKELSGPELTKLMYDSTYTFHLHATEATKKVYLEHNKVTYFPSSCIDICEKCNKCNKTHVTFNNKQYEQLIYSLNLRENSGCDFNNFDIISPSEIIKCIIHALNCYNNREKVVRKNSKLNKEYNSCKVHVATPNEQLNDKVIMLPLVEYVKEYKASIPYVYKGGHHASPVAHQRSGYFRKSKQGSYIRTDTGFKFVGKGNGDYTYVQPTVVNNKTDRIIIFKA